MAHFVIQNFGNGLDLRKSSETALTGSLRVLENAFINQGGEIEKRKAFVLDETLTAYGQNANYKGRITGPHECPGYDNTVFFRHRHDSLPGWTAGAGSIAEYYEVGSQTLRFWAQKSTVTATGLGALFHAESYSEFSTNGYVVEGYLSNVTDDWDYDHVYVTFTDDEPTSESEVAVNADRPFQMTLQTKGYVVRKRTMFASAVGDPEDMTSGAGYGAVDLTTQSKPIGDALSVAEYYGQLAIFGKKGVMFWTVDPDFALNQYQRSIPTSVFSGRSVTGYGAGDVLYLARDGVRSLQARDSSNLAKVSDVGSAIDTVIEEALDYSKSLEEKINTSAVDVPNADYYEKAVGAVHSASGQFWLCLKEKVYVLSSYPNAKVLGWSEFALPLPDPDNENTKTGFYKGAWVADICQIRETLVFRNYADEVYIYGGPNGESYDDAKVVVETPYMDFQRPGYSKTFNGIDLVCTGSWDVYISLDSKNPEWELVANITDSSHAGDRISFDVSSTKIALRLECRSQYNATLSQVVVYYNGNAEK